MVSEMITITNKSGIHARPASELAKVAMKCSSNVIIRVGDREVNPKSILNLMAAAIKNGTQVLVECSGESEKEDLVNILNAISGGLGE